MAMFFNGIRATDCEEIVNTVSGRFSADLIGAHGNADDGSNPDGLLGFKGWMNNPRVWATVRSQQQIADNADRQVAADAEGLVSAWDFRETDFTDGGTVPDITGNHNGQWQFRGDGGGSSCHSMDSRIAGARIDESYMAQLLLRSVSTTCRRRRRG